jgi:hypothetical protein
MRIALGAVAILVWGLASADFVELPPLKGATHVEPTSAPTTSAQPTATPSGPISTETRTGTQAVGATSDPRLRELQTTYATLLEQARSRKITYLKAARLYREGFNGLYPEQASNDLMNEYLAYMATVGERIDKKKLTEAEAEYELAKKMSELRDRALAREAPRREEAARRASDEAARAEKLEAARAEQEQRRIAQERDLAERRAAQERALAQQRELAAQAVAQAAAQAEKDRKLKESQEMMMTGLQILLGPRTPPPQNCTGRWIGPNWVQSCF